MQLIALTGSICSGKSTILKMLEQQGIATLDSDGIVKQLYRKKPIQKKLLAEFGTFNKKKIASIVFSNRGKRKRLESILHPLVKKEIKKREQAFKRRKKKAVVVDVPLLFEAKWQSHFDSVIVVRAGKQQCLQRAKKKGLTKKEFLLRYKAQMPLGQKIKKAFFASQKTLGKKIKRAQHVIDNTKSLANTRKQVKELARDLKALPT